MVTPEARLALGAALAALVAAAARRLQLLSRGGAWAAVACGAAVTAAGWTWSAALLLFFVTSAALSRWRRGSKDRATGDVVEKAGPRDAWQVMANGGVLTACAVAFLLAPGARWAIAGLGAIAAAMADTWATEVGTAIGGQPRALPGLAPVPPGTSGAVSLAGRWPWWQAPRSWAPWPGRRAGRAGPWRWAG